VTATQNTDVTQDTAPVTESAAGAAVLAMVLQIDALTDAGEEEAAPASDPPPSARGQCGEGDGTAEDTETKQRAHLASSGWSELRPPIKCSEADPAIRGPPSPPFRWSNSDLADSELRRRGGFVSTARHARESEVLARREAELAEGHASFRYSGYVTISAASEEELVAACDVVQHAAGQSRLALRRLYGDQASAYTCTLPLCRGLH
jgi:hypothetical protein